MKKIITTILVCCTCLLVAQDIAGSYRATGQRVQYEFYTRPNVEGSTTYAASGNADGSTSLRINDIYGLGVSSSVSDIPVGYNFYTNIVGPIGQPEMDAMQYYLYVTFNEDNTGAIYNSQVLASETVDCETSIQLLPLDDDLTYTSDLTADLTVQSTMVTGQANASDYVGESAGSWSISGSSFFSFFPASPSPVTAEFQLYGYEFAGCYGACLQGTPAQTAGIDVNMDGVVNVADDHAFCGGLPSSQGGCADFVHGYPGMPHPGATSGYIIPDPAVSFAPSNNVYGLLPDYHVEWHYIDGPLAETGLGDIVGDEEGADEDLDGTVYDNILGYPALVSTYTTGSVECGGHEMPILGDLTEDLPEACISHVSEANDFYVMSADYSIWGNMLTWNAVMYSQTEDVSFLVDDSGWELDPADITMLDLDGDGTPETPYSVNGGKLVMNFDATCIPVVSAISVLGELTSVGDDCGSGDTNADGDVNVQDVVAVVGYILGTNATVSCADVNVDGNVDVMDVVQMVSLILGNRGEEASSATFTKTENGVSMASNGVVGAVQMTLAHDSDFSIDLTDNAFVAEYHTEGSTTTLIVVNPTDEVLFEANGNYTIEEVIAANTGGYVTTNVNVPDAITLSAAYPNPFNPSTSFDLNVSQAGNISVMIYNVNGQVVDVLHQGYKDAGVHTMTLNGQNLASGMYIIKANSADITVSQKVMLIK